MTLKQGQEENATHRRCRQIQCSYFQQGHCQACEECGAKSYELKKSCKRCIDCEGVPGELRWDNGQSRSESKKQQEKLVELFEQVQKMEKSKEMEKVIEIER